MSHYILKNKDRVVLEFEVLEKEKEFESGKAIIEYIENINLKSDILPFGIDKTKLSSSLQSWIKNRKIPKNRAFFNELIASYQKERGEKLMDYIDVSLGLSLNDSYWIIPSDKNYKWKYYNLYKNPFNETLALVAFAGISNRIRNITSSPEFTTNGMLKKCWYRENNQIYLYKGNAEAKDSKEAYSEYYMAQVAKAMNFNAITYDLKLFHNELVSTCAIFTNENEGYVPIHLLLSKPLKDYNKAKLIEEISTLYGKEAFEDLMVFDALICNIDRHLGNFGMIVDNDTLEILRPAPIFDNGLSFIATLDKNNSKDISKCIAKDISYFELQFDEQLELFSEKRHIPNLEKLTQFSFQRHTEFNLSEEWLSPIEECIRKRATMALEFIEKKKQYSIQSNANELDKLIESIDQAQSEQDTRVSNKTKQNLFENQESLQTQTNENKALAKKLRKPKQKSLK